MSSAVVMGVRFSRRVALLVSLTLACAHAPVPAAAPATEPAADAKPVSDEMAPTPFTADQIRKATAVGRTYEYRLEVTGKPDTRHVMSFTRVVTTDADIVDVLLDEQGATVEAPKTSLITWDELRRHTEFPVSAVDIASEQVTIPAGTFDCLRYTVTPRPGEQLRFYFAKSMPGMPVLSYAEKDGKRLSTETLIRYQPGG